MSVHEHARDDIRALPLYVTESRPDALDLSDNTNLWGSPPAALRALVQGLPRPSAYPTLYSSPLKHAIARSLGLQDRSDIGVVTGCGSDGVLDSLMRAFGRPGARIAFPSPTFSMIPSFARLNGLEPVAIPLTDAFDADADRLVDARAAITYLCTPNNPTATPLSRAVIEHVVSNAAGVVVIDEAYAEFAPDTFVDVMARHERVLIARTFSKAFGLAGLRVGFGVASRELADIVERARGPYKVGSLAEAAALASLGDEEDALPWVRRHVAMAIEVRDRLAAALRSRGLAPLPSAANFLCVPTANARRIGAGLRDRGILVRVVSELPRAIAAFEASNGFALRIGVGPWESMERLLIALDEVMT